MSGGRRIPRPLPIARQVGANIRQIRKRRGLTMTKLVACTELLGFRIPISALTEMEAGINSAGTPRSVTVDELEVLARALRVPPVQLLGPPKCQRCWDVPLPEFTCQRCGTAGAPPPPRSATTRRPQTSPETGHNRA